MKRMEFYVDDEDEGQIRLYAEFTGRTVSNLVRHCIKSEISRRNASFERWKQNISARSGNVLPHMGK